MSDITQDSFLRVHVADKNDGYMSAQSVEVNLQFEILTEIKKTNALLEQLVEREK